MSGGCQDICGSKRMEKEFKKLTLQEASSILMRNEAGINILQNLLALVLFLWMLATMIPGFSLYDGTANQISAFTHAGFWIGLQFIVLYIGASATKFGIHYSVSDGVVEKGVGAAFKRMYWYKWLLFLGLIAHIFHAVFMGMESQNCDSTLCGTYTWAYWLTLVFICIHPFIHAWLIFRVQVYEANLSAAIGYDKIDAIIYGIPDEEKPFLKPAKYPPTSDFDAQISNNPARDRVRRAKIAMKKR